MQGGSEYDVLYGGEGSDILDGGDAHDYMVGGPGDDIYYWNGSGEEPVIEAPREGMDLAIARQGTLPDNIENLTLSSYNGSQGKGNALDNIIIGDQFINQLIGLGGSDTITGGGGNDTLIGDGEGSDTGQVSLYNVGNGVGGMRFLGEDNSSPVMGSAGDVNGDDIPDVWVGAPNNAEGGDRAGAAYVVFGPFTNDWQIKLADVANGMGGYKIVGGTILGYVGGTVTNAGRRPANLPYQCRFYRKPHRPRPLIGHFHCSRNQSTDPPIHLRSGHSPRLWCIQPHRRNSQLPVHQRS